MYVHVSHSTITSAALTNVYTEWCCAIFGEVFLFVDIISHTCIICNFIIILVFGYMYYYSHYLVYTLGLNSYMYYVAAVTSIC